MTAKSHFYYGYVVVTISFFIVMVILGIQSCFGIFIKPIADELGWTRSLISGAFSVSQIVGGILFILMGALNDRFGLRMVLVLCSVFSVAGYVLMFWAHSPWQLYLFSGVLIGAGASIFVPLLSSVARWFVKRRSLMTGIVFAGSGFGLIAFPPLINSLIAHYDWRSSFLFLGFIVLGISLLAVLLLKSGPVASAAESSDGQAARSEGNKSGDKAYSLRQALQTRQFWIFCIAVMCYGFCFFSIQVHIAPHITDLGFSSANAALAISIIGGAAIVGQLGFGIIGDRIGYKNAFLIGMFLFVMAILALILARDLWTFFIFAVLLGLAFGDCGTQESPITAWLFGLASHGSIFGCFAFSFSLGASIGPLVFGYLYDAHGTYQQAFYLSIGLASLATLLTLFLNKTPVGPVARIERKYLPG